jgi:hypothetical protein
VGTTDHRVLRRPDAELMHATVALATVLLARQVRL